MMGYRPSKFKNLEGLFISQSYSDRKLFTGLAKAARMA